MQNLSIEELQTVISTAQRRISDPELSQSERDIFSRSLENAQRMLAALTSPSTPPPAAQPSFRTAAAANRFGRPAPQASQAAQASAQEQGQGSAPDAQAAATPTEKKKATRSAAQNASILSPLPRQVFEAQVKIDDSRLTVRFTGCIVGEVVLTPGQVKSRIRQNLGQVVKMTVKEPAQSRCYHRAVVYYSALCQRSGKVLTAQEVGLKRKHSKATTDLFNQIQAAQSAL